MRLRLSRAVVSHYSVVVAEILLRLFALPSLYRQMNLDRAALYESDLTLLLARYRPKLPPLLELVETHVEPEDVRELRKLAAELAERAARLRLRTGR